MGGKRTTPGKFKRSTGTRDLRKVVRIYFEDERSAKDYLPFALKELGFNLKKPRVEFRQARSTDPKDIVAEAREFVTEYKKANPKGVHAWAVFDHDGKPSFAQACEACDAKRVHNGMTNPCFEYWLLLHIERPKAGTVDTHTKAQNGLKDRWRELLKQDYEKGKADFASFLQHADVDLTEAIDRSAIERNNHDGLKTPWADRTPCSHLGAMFEWFQNGGYKK